MNRKIKQNQELKKSARKSRENRKRVFYNGQNSPSAKRELTPNEKAIQKKRVEDYKNYVKKRERTILIITLFFIFFAFFLIINFLVF